MDLHPASFARLLADVGGTHIRLARQFAPGGTLPHGGSYARSSRCSRRRGWSGGWR